MTALHTIERAGYTAQVVHDMDADSPAGWCNYGTLAYSIPRYGTAGEMPAYWEDYGLANCLPADALVILPVRAWDDRNGTELRVADSWDEANGFIYSDGACSCGCGASHADLSREAIESALKAELETWQMWAQGDVYGVVIQDPAGNHVDSCFGFYGYDYALAEAETMLDIEPVLLAENYPMLVVSL